MRSVFPCSSPALRLHAATGSMAMPGRPRALAAPGEASDLPNAHDFLAMQGAYRSSGGIARSDDLERLRDALCQDALLTLERLIATRRLFGFEWQGSCWIPMFQFDAGDLTLRHGTGRVLAEWDGVLDGWGLALWFCAPSAWLFGQRPVDRLDSDLPAVLAAARTDRYVITG